MQASQPLLSSVSMMNLVVTARYGYRPKVAVTTGGNHTTDLPTLTLHQKLIPPASLREQLVAHVQAKVDAVTYIGTDSVAHTGLPLTVGYDLKTRALTFTPTDATYGSIKASSPSTVSAFGLDSATATFSAVGDVFTGGQIVPTGPVSSGR